MEGTMGNLKKRRNSARVPETEGEGGVAKLRDGPMGAGERNGVLATSEWPVWDRRRGWEGGVGSVDEAMDRIRGPSPEF